MHRAAFSDPHIERVLQNKTADTLIQTTSQIIYQLDSLGTLLVPKCHSESASSSILCVTS